MDLHSFIRTRAKTLLQVVFPKTITGIHVSARVSDNSVYTIFNRNLNIIFANLRRILESHPLLLTAMKPR